MKQICTTFLLAAVLAISANAAFAQFVYVHNVVNGGSEAIFGYRLNAATGELAPLAGFPVGTGGTGTSFALSETLAVNEREGLLFVVNDGPNTLSIYAIDPDTGALTQMPFSPVALGTANWSTVAVNPAGAQVIVGGMLTASSGIVRSFLVTENGIAEGSGSPAATGSATPFSSAFSRDGQYFYTGGFTISLSLAGYSVDAATASISPLAGSPFNTGGSNPAGISTDSAGRIFLVDNVGRIRVFTTLSGIPAAVPGSPFAGIGGGIDSVLHPSGQYLYVAGRATERLAQFTLAGDGTSTTAGLSASFPTLGSIPNMVALDRSGSILLAANSNSRNLAVFGVSANGAALGYLGTQPANTLGSTGRLVGMTVYAPIAPAEVPPGEMILQLISAIEAFDPPLKRGIARSLLAKLENAVADLDAGDTAGAVEKLTAFLNHVRAQTGKHISAERAAFITEAANAILEALNGKKKSPLNEVKKELAKQ